jgi:hypothetical protein
MGNTQTQANIDFVRLWMRKFDHCFLICVWVYWMLPAIRSSSNQKQFYEKNY